jgi:hypothetical protein
MPGGTPRPTPVHAKHRESAVPVCPGAV